MQFDWNVTDTYDANEYENKNNNFSEHAAAVDVAIADLIANFRTQINWQIRQL